MPSRSLTRRRLLAAVGSFGAAALAGLGVFTTESHAFTHTTRLQIEEMDGILLDWRETYNGALLSDTTNGTATPEPTGPAISLGNVLPGDSGSFSAQVRIEPEEEDEEAGDLEAEIELELELTSELESPGLQEFVHAAVWYDSGLAGIDAFGARNDEQDLGENLVHPDAEGTLGEVAAALGDGVTLDASPNRPGEDTCLGVDDSVTVTFGWWFPPNQENINAIQGDEVEFDLRFMPEQC